MAFNAKEGGDVSNYATNRHSAHLLLKLPILLPVLQTRPRC
jgi:hypothetical protein